MTKRWPWLGLVAVGLAIAWLAWPGERAAPEVTDAAPPALAVPRARIQALLHPATGAIDGGVASVAGPVAGAAVCVRAEGDDLDDARCTTADAAGAFALAELPPATYRIWASTDALATLAPPDPIALAPGARVTVALQLAPAARVRGRVVDIRDRPIAQATVHVGAARSALAGTATTAADGTFAAVAPPGDVTVFATAAGFVDAERDATAPGPDVVVRLTPESVLAGVVVDAASRAPVADATVSAGGEHATTGADGRFRLAKLTPGRYKPTATAIGGYGEARESVRVSLGETAADVTIELHPVAAAIGQIAIAGTSPERTCPPGDGDVYLTRYGSAQGYHARTIADGTIILEGVVPGTYEVAAACKGYVSAVPYPDLTIATTDLADLVWHVSVGARITGTVVDAATRAPVAGATVNHVDAGGMAGGSVVTDARGAFAIDGVQPGLVDLVAYADGYARAGDDAAVRVAAARDAPASATLVVHRGGTIEGIVVDARGQPAPGVEVRADGASAGSTRTDAAGAFAFTALEPGEHDVYLHPEWLDSAAVRTTVMVTLDRPARVRLVDPAADGTLAGAVVDARGAPVADAYVEAARLDRDDARPYWHDPAILVNADGTFAFAHLPAGNYLVRARRPGGAEAVLAAPVPAGTSGLRLALPATGTLAGIVTTPSGAPVDDVTVAATDRHLDRDRSERLFHTGGRFALRELPAGTYRVTVDDDPRSAVTVTLADGEQRTDLHLIAQPRFTIRGRLVDAATRAPLASWKVEAPRVELEEHTGTRDLTVSSTETVLTDADGRFLIRNMPSGELAITAADAVHAADAKPRAVTTVTLGGATTFVDLGDVSPGAAAAD